MQRLYTLIISCLLFTACHTPWFTKVSRQVQRSCSPKNKMFNKLRIQLYENGHLNFIDKGFTRLFILEAFDIQTAHISGRIWDADSTLSYTYDHTTGLKLEETDLFTDLTIQLIEKWDTAQVRKEEKLHGAWLGAPSMEGIELTNTNGKLTIRCIRFKYFFDPERDIKIPKERRIKSTPPSF